MVLKRCICIIVLCVLGVTGARAQEQWRKEIDSLKAIAGRVGNADANVLFQLGEHFEANAPDSAVAYYKAANAICEKDNDNNCKLRYLAHMTAIFEAQAKYDEALKCCEASVALSKQWKQTHALGAAYSNIATIYSDMGNSEKAITYYHMAAALYEQANDPKDNINRAYVYGNILSEYVLLDQQSKAYGYGLKALSFSLAAKDDIAVALAAANLSALLLKMNKYDSALTMAKLEYDLAKKHNDKPYMINALGCMNNVYLRTGRYPVLKENASEMDKLATESKDMNGMILGTYFLAEYYFESKDLAAATGKAMEALRIIDCNKVATNSEADLHLLLGETALAVGDMPSFHQHGRIYDSLQNVYASDKIMRYNQQMQAQYELEKRRAEIAALNKDNRIKELTLDKRKTAISVLLCLVLVITAISILYYRNYRHRTRLLVAEDVVKKQRINELETEKQLLIVRSVLQGQEEERKRLATDLHDGLGGILSSTKYSFNNMKEYLIIPPDAAQAFDSSMAMLDLSILELRRVARNMMPEALVKFGLNVALQDLCAGMNQNGKVAFTYQSFNVDDPNISKSTAAAVYRVIQELTNNILKHADATTALIQLIQNDTALSITVEDNGKGLDTNILGNNAGMGYTILKSRIAYLQGTIEIHSAADSGTSICIEIPDITI